MATLTALVKSFADTISFANNLSNYFNVNTALGDQLNKLGAWVGVSRYVPIALTGYFSLDSATLGLDQASMLGPGDPLTGLVALPDNAYQQLIKMYIGLYKSKGTKQELYNLLSPLFVPAKLIIQGQNNNTVFFGLEGTPLNSIFLQMFTGGFLSPTAAGVQAIGNLTSFNALTLTYPSNVNLDNTFAYNPVDGANSGIFTLNANSTSTTVSISGISASSTVIWSANTKDAANAIPFMRGVPGTNQVVFTHASNAAVDQNFSYIAYTSGLKGSFTLNANSTSTTVSISGSTSTSQIYWAPTTANGASALPEMYATPGTNQVVFTHASNSHVDQTFNYILLNP